MIDPEQMQLLIYNHVVQLTLIDYDVEQAFAVAHRPAALGFDEHFMRDGLAAARQADDDKTAHGTGAAASGTSQER